MLIYDMNDNDYH